ncbi:MAG TPA: 2OG-Fe(II) oxygenase [Pseudomonas sp.]|jgi:SM-20-related protein|nr:2OG-Fe(II) oxygenase [Pseudomonas sp.]
MRDFSDSRGSPVLANIIDDLVARGWSLQPGFISQSLTTQLAHECRARYAAGELIPAGIGRGDGKLINESIRSDSILWVDPGQSEACDLYLQAIDELRLTINRELFLGLEDLECHFAVYPPGGFYQRHLDRFRDDDRRTVTVVMYLNDPDWSEADGGQLRMYLPEGERDVVPVGGLLACFMSDRIPHEVLPARRERLALTGWLRRRA